MSEQVEKKKEVKIESDENQREMKIEAIKVGERRLLDRKQEEAKCGYITVPMRFVGKEDGEVVYTSPTYAVQAWGAGTTTSTRRYSKPPTHEVSWVIEVLKTISKTNNDTGGRMNAFLDGIWKRWNEMEKCTCEGEGEGVNGSGHHYDGCPALIKPDPMQGSKHPKKPFYQSLED